MKKILTFALAFAMVLSLAACGGSTGTADSKSANDRELVMTIGKDLTTLDPFKCTGSSSWRCCKSIYDVPWVYTKDYQVVYRACTGFEFSEDGLSLTATLREGMKFSNGDPVTAEDFAYSIDMCKTGPITLTWASKITNIEVLSDTQVKVTLDAVYAPLTFAMQDVTIVSKKAHEAASADFGYTPVGSGPYTLGEYKVGDYVTLKANDSFYNEVGVKNVKYKLIPEAESVSIALQSGEVGYSSDYASIDYESLSALENLQVYEMKNLDYEFATYNVTIAPFDNKYFRQAMNYALDRQSMIDIVANGNGYIEYNIWCDQVFGYKKMEGWPYSVEKAKECLEKAGYPNGEGVPEITIYCYGDSGAREAQIIQESLKAIGIEWPVEQVDMNFLWDGQSDGSIAFSVDGMGLGIDASEYATMLETGGGFNSAWYANPEMDELFAKAAGTAVESERLDYYGQIIDLEQEEAPYMVLYYSISKILCDKDLDLSAVKDYTYIYPQYLTWK